MTRLAEDEFFIVGSGMAERYHQRFFKVVPRPDWVVFESKTEAICGLNVAGPRARDLLQRLTNISLATADFPFMRFARITLAGVDLIVLRVSFTGDLRWELHCRREDQAQLCAALLEAGKNFVAGLVGSRALMSLRWKRAIVLGGAGIHQNAGHKKPGSTGS